MLKIDQKSITAAIRKIQDEYKNVSGDILTEAISRALTRTAQQGRTEASKEIRKRYNLGASRLNAVLKSTRSTKNTLLAKIYAIDAPLSLTNFQARQEGRRGTTQFDRKGNASTRLTRKSRTNAIKGVTLTIKKGEQVNIPTAFIQTANGGITVFARGHYKDKGEGFEFAKERLPIAKLTTTSIPLMFANNEVMDAVQRKTEDVLSDRIVTEMNWLLQK